MLLSRRDAAILATDSLRAFLTAPGAGRPEPQAHGPDTHHNYPS